MIKAVVFDLDDTLISELDYVKSGFNHIASLLSNNIKIDHNNIFSELMELFNSNPKKIFNRFYEKHEISYSNKMILDLVNEYREHLPDIQFYNDVLPCLKGLKRLGIKTGIITDGYAISQRQKLRAIEADKFFDEIIVADEYGKDFWKPNSKSFNLMKEKLNIDFHDMVYVGDNPEKDFYISKIYPIRTVRIYRDGIYISKPYLENVKETYHVHNLVEIINLIKFNHS